MFRTLGRIQWFLASEDGPTAVEYAVMLALIITVCIATIRSLGTTVTGPFSSVQTTAFGS